MIDAAVGFTAAVAFVVLHAPLRFPLAALAFAVGASGAWGILDRETRDAHRPARQSLRVARNIVGALGVVAALVGACGVFFGLLGRWIS